MRLAKICRDFNVGIETVVEFLRKYNIQVENNPNAKVEDGCYALIQSAFGNNNIEQHDSLSDTRNSLSLKNQVLRTEEDVNHQSWTTVDAVVDSLRPNTRKKNDVSYFSLLDQDGKSVFLLEDTKVGSGGEAQVFKYRKNLAAKIYRSYDEEREAKLKILLTKDLDKAFCLPQRLLYDKKGRIVGYLMPFIKGHILGESIFQPMEFKQLFPRPG